MPIARRRLLVALACLAAALTVGATPLAACDPMWLPVARPEGISILVVAALAETVLDTVAGSIAARTHRAFGNRLDAYSGKTPGGQRVRLLRRHGEHDTGSEAVLVPWAYRDDCRPIGWTGPLDWIVAVTPGAVTGWLRPREHWLGGLPTFDVEMAWREPIWAEREPRWHSDEGDPRRMTPEEFVQFYPALPSFEQMERRPAEAAARMREWERAHAALAALAPATTILGGIYRAAAERHRGALGGRWTAEIALLDSRELPLPTTSRTISGELQLEPVGGDSAEVYRGASALDWTPFGFQVGTGEILVVVEHASVRMILDPTVDHGHVVATLTGGAEELAGTWYLNGRPARAKGTIALRRPALR